MENTATNLTFWEKVKAFLKRKDIEISLRRYGIDALGAMAQGLFCSLLIGTIIRTLGQQLGVQFLTDIGSYAMAVSGMFFVAKPWLLRDAIAWTTAAPPCSIFSDHPLLPAPFGTPRTCTGMPSARAVARKCSRNPLW